ncbi:NACHT domain-containing protein [Streptomyces sp. DT24]|uniref:NACHT domain-containing protein n=1 Tax=Streptomyces sp. DT24 TaxID=3416520 RepID=UPI003CF20770
MSASAPGGLRADDPGAHPTDGTAPGPRAHPTDRTAAGPGTHPTDRAVPEPGARPTARTAPGPGARPTARTAPGPGARPTDRTTSTPDAHPTDHTAPSPRARPTARIAARPGTRPTDRTVVVSGLLQGSGVLLTDRLVLTCAHVVRTSAAALIAQPSRGGVVRGTVAWIDHDLDAALLFLATPAAPVPPVRLGALADGQVLPGCELTGFPDIQRYGSDRRLEADQYTATVLPAAGLTRGLLVCQLDGPPPFDAAGARVPALSGLSGGPLFAGDVLLGIARQVPRQRGGRRVECVPLHALLRSRTFRTVCEQSGARPRLEKVHGHHPQDRRYEEDYAASLGTVYRRTKIFGLDELAKHDSEWDLDTAYLSLEAQHRGAAPGLTPEAAPAPQRVDALLADRPRVLLRGDAGAGKTTLVWWLAAHASAGTLGPRLAALNGLVPFVVPLRTLRARGEAFPTPARLPSAARLVIDDAPDGWAGRVLESGRGLLLVDGLDEVPPDDREEAHDWLSRLLERYPETRCVATVRPLAVEPDWLLSQGFEELRLLPMRDDDVRAFVAAWHRAARLDGDAHEDLAELERDLAQQLARNTTLSDLARTPLLCAVICALHRRRQGFLPETRWQLYDSALAMLLGNRDKRRRIKNPEGVSVTVEEQAQLLQRIAVWLVREGQTEFSRDQALRRIDRALSGMERIQQQGPPEKILTHLLNRSGLLLERADDTYQFAHRTFQDFLAAKEFVEDDHLGELLRHAAEETWQDVILLAAGHCGRRELPLLVNGLLDVGEERTDAPDRAGIHVLAALCARHAAWLDAATRERVKRCTAALFPPTAFHEVRTLARLGASGLALLPSPEEFEGTAGSVHAVAELIIAVGGHEAVPHARTWALAHERAVEVFAHQWFNFPPQAFATEVLGLVDLEDRMVDVHTADQLASLIRLPRAKHITVLGDFTDDALDTSLSALRLYSLVVARNAELTNITWLRRQGETLTALHLLDCPGVQDASVLVSLTQLVTLGLSTRNLGCPRDSACASIAALDSLRHLTVHSVDTSTLAELPAHPGLTSLTAEWTGPALTVTGLARWPALTWLCLAGRGPVVHLADALREAPHLTHLHVRGGSRLELTGDPVPSVLDLCLPVRTDGDLIALAKRFPSLTHLKLYAGQGAVFPLDLSPLRALPELRIEVELNTGHLSDFSGTDGLDLAFR